MCQNKIAGRTFWRQGRRHSCSLESRRRGACSSSLSCRGTDFPADRPCWRSRCLLRPTVSAAQWAGFCRTPAARGLPGLWGTALLAGGFFAAALVPARERRAVSRRLQRARGAGQRVFSPGGAGVCAEVVSGQKGLGHRRGGRRHGAVRRVFYGVRQGCRRGVGHPGLLCRVRGGHARRLRRGGADFAGPAAQSAERPAAAGT